MKIRNFLLFVSYAYSRIIRYLTWLPFRLMWLVGIMLQGLSLGFRQRLAVDNFATRHWLDFIQKRLHNVSTTVKVLGEELKFTYQSSQEFWRIKTIALKEPDTVAWIARMAATHPNATFVDVGANIGIYSMLWLKVSKGDVVCVEPLPSNILALLRNIRENEVVGRTKVVQAAAYSESKMLDFFSPTIFAGEGFGSTQPSELHFEDQYGLLVSGISISSLNLTNTDVFVKIDVEGAELEVVRGLFDLLQKGQIKSILFEKNKRQNEVLEFLASHKLREVELAGIGNVICDLIT